MNIPSAKEMWETQTNKGDFDKAVESVLREIDKARKAGKRQAHFDPRPCNEYSAVKHAFTEKEYWFTPTGYIGGVWQRTENINW